MDAGIREETPGFRDKELNYLWHMSFLFSSKVSSGDVERPGGY